MGEYVVNATVNVTLKVTLSQPWSDDCPVKQVRVQAERAALEAVQRLLDSGEPGSNVSVRSLRDHHVTIVTGRKGETE